MSNSSCCSYGTLARVYVEDDAWAENDQFNKGCFKRNKKAPYIADKDLLLALGESSLVVFRRQQLQSRSCVCMSIYELTLESSLQQRQASEYQCPHIHSFDDYEQWAIIEYSAIVQVQLAFTKSSQCGGLAAKRKDVVVVVKDGSKLWLEFEHNLSRGAFLDALMAASAPHVMLNLDCTDYSKPVQDAKAGEVSGKGGDEHVTNQASSRMLFDFQRAASRLAVMLAIEIDAEDLDVALYGEVEHGVALPMQTLSGTYTGLNQPLLAFSFKREAIRKAIVIKVQLALQISSEVDLDSPQCHFLLGTAMELSRALDEPDLYALTWLVSGFINLQRAILVTTLGSTKLAQSQLEYAITIAREHSFRHLLALSLACCGDLHRLSTRKLSTARMYFIEAAKLMPLNALDLVGKMQLHNKIHQLGLALSPCKDGENQDKNVIDLCKALSTAMSNPRSIESENPTDLLMRPVSKSSSKGLHSCIVEIFVLSSAGTTTGPVQLLRVYFSEHLTFEWLRQEITERCNIVPLSKHEEDGNEPLVAQVIGFYDSVRENRSMISWNARIFDVSGVDWHVFRAVVVQQRVKVESEEQRSLSNLEVVPIRPSVAVRCFKCRIQMHLSEVKGHSETCN